MLKRGSKDWDRFWSRVTKGPGCWTWDNLSHSGGYREIYIKPNKLLAHRVACMLGHGCIPEGMFVCHHCDNRGCIRPSHLFLGTSKDNMVDASNKKRLGKCYGTAHQNAKLTDTEIKQIRKDTNTHRTIAKKYNVSHNTIGTIKRRQTWKHIT